MPLRGFNLVLYIKLLRIYPLSISTNYSKLDIETIPDAFKFQAEGRCSTI